MVDPVQKTGMISEDKVIEMDETKTVIGMTEVEETHVRSVGGLEYDVVL